MKRFLNRIEELWCVHMHEKVMWPIRGHYFCAVCLREFPALPEPSPVKATEIEEDQLLPEIAVPDAFLSTAKHAAVHRTVC